MISQKVCLVGSFAVGKTSLIKQFVHSIFSDAYLSTIGLKISKKVMEVEGKQLSFVLWDLEGKDCYAEVNTAFLRGASAFFIVADLTRRETLTDALYLRTQVLQKLGDKPHFLLLNKHDLTELHDFTPHDFSLLDEEGVSYLFTSAKTGKGVEDAFLSLAQLLLPGVCRV